MNDTQTQTTEETPKQATRPCKAHDEKSANLGWGVFFVLAGLALFAKEMGWISIHLGWVLPAILLALGASALYEAFKTKA